METKVSPKEAFISLLFSYKDSERWEDFGTTIPFVIVNFKKSFKYGEVQPGPSDFSSS